MFRTQSKIIFVLGLAILLDSKDALSVTVPKSIGTALTAKDDKELSSRISAAKYGQHILLTGKLYTQDRTIDTGTIIRAADIRHMPVVQAHYNLSGNDIYIEGLDFSGKEAGVDINGDRIHFSRSKIHDIGKATPIGVGDGDGIEIAHNEIYNWGTTAACGSARGLSIRSPLPTGRDGATHIQVYRNYFHDQIGYNSESCDNDAEVIAAGQTHVNGRYAGRMEGLFRHNYFVNTAGDNEGFGIKSSYNRIEFNHLKGARGFNLRIGGFNEFVGNRVEGTPSFPRPGGNRGGYKNLSLGEVMDGTLDVFGGTHSWLDQQVGSFLQSDGTKVIGARVRKIEVGVDSSSRWTMPALNTLIQSTSVAPEYGTDQKLTDNEWNKSPSMAVPEAVRLDPSLVGPYATAP